MAWFKFREIAAPMPSLLFPAADAETLDQLKTLDTLRLFDGFDWANHPLGPVEAWSAELLAAVRLVMTASVPMALFVGPDATLLYNDPYRPIAAANHPRVFGLSVFAGWPEVADFNRNVIDLVQGQGRTLTYDDQQFTFFRNGGPEAVWLDIDYSPIRDAGGKPFATLAVLTEKTGQVLAQSALARSEERLTLALGGTTLVGTWDWDVLNDVVTADERFARLYNLDPLRAALGIEIARFLDAIHPEDRESVAQSITEVLASGKEYRAEYRLVDPDGGVRWVVASGRPRMGENGKAVRFPGVVMDITDQKEVAQALADSETRFRTLADTMPQMVWSTRPDGYHDYYNARWYEFTGTPIGSTDGEGWNGMFHPDDQERSRTVWRLSLATGEPYRIEYRLRHHSGQYRWVLGQALPIFGPDGEIVRWFGTCTDIHESRVTAEEREVVAQELSHRIKNIFSVISGIVSLSARAHPEMKPLADELRSRIVALGQAHDFVRPHTKLPDERPPQTSLQGLVQILVGPYDRQGKARIAFAGPDAQIDDGAATPLALLFHELATNSVKYGALSSDGGKVALTSHIEGDQYHMVWKETGGPPRPDGSDLPGFGSRLMSLSVEGQLRGTLERVWEDDGLRIDFTMPLASLRRSAALKKADA